MSLGVLETEPQVRAVEAELNYVAPDSLINRRFVAPGIEHNTGRFEPHAVLIRDGRSIRDRFTPDSHGFCLATHRSAVKDFGDRAEVDAIYTGEVAEAVKALTGASRVATMGWVARTAGSDIEAHRKRTPGYSLAGAMQPPASDVHVDMTSDRAGRLAQAIYQRTFPDGAGYSRFIASSFWRATSDPPQDWPLAVCDGSSVSAEEGLPNTMFVVDELPSAEAMLGEMPTEDSVPAAAIFRYSPGHRWWYFSDMTRDEAILVKFHDSDHSRAWRAPHTAFKDPTFPHARPRHSIEFRTVAFFE